MSSRQPDKTLHWVPFVFAGEIDAYKLVRETAPDENYAANFAFNRYLFVSKYNVIQNVRWDSLNSKDLIFGQDYTSGGIRYILRAPSGGSAAGDTGGVPGKNEWDRIEKYTTAEQNKYSCGQDTVQGADRGRVLRSRGESWYQADQSREGEYKTDFCFRPVLEVNVSDYWGPDNAQVVKADLNGGKIGNLKDPMLLVVAKDKAYRAPSGEGIKHPSLSFSCWLGDNGGTYLPGAEVPAGVSLTAQWQETQTSSGGNDDDDDDDDGGGSASVVRPPGQRHHL